MTSPAPKFFLGGVENDHLYHNNTLALELETGEIRWYYQHLNDHWDLDHPFERLLVDTTVAPDPDEVEWINPDLEAKFARSSPVFQARPAWFTHWTARPVSFCGQHRQRFKTLSRILTAPLARLASTRK